MGIFISYIKDNLVVAHTDQWSNFIYSYLVKVIIFLLLTSSIICLLQSIRTATYEQVSLQKIVDKNLAKKNAGEVMISIAATYKEAINNNRNRINRKIVKFDRGLVMLQAAIIAFILYLIIEELGKYVG